MEVQIRGCMRNHGTRSILSVVIDKCSLRYDKDLEAVIVNAGIHSLDVSRKSEYVTTPVFEKADVLRLFVEIYGDQPLSAAIADLQNARLDRQRG